MWWYNIGMHAYAAAIRMVSPWNPKARLWCRGRKNIFERMRREITPGGPVVWVHAASLGEFEQARPVMEAVRRDFPQYRILLTFFSPSGYEIRKNYQGADFVFYLPADTPANVRRFMDAVRPEAAIIVKYEFWLNYLAELSRRGVRTYVISSIFRRDSVFFRWYGGAFRRALRVFDTLFVQNDESVSLLASIGIRNVVRTGDTRFDRVAAISAEPGSIEIMERFAPQRDVFVAGSTWGPDEQILLQLINENPDVRFVVAPHEIDRSRIAEFAGGVKGGAVCYSQCTPGQDLSAVQVLVLDTVGLLSRVYAYGRWAYIGGGFGVGIHNTLEAAVFSLPLAFGPNYRRFREAVELIGAGAACSVDSAQALGRWFDSVRAGDALSRAGQAAGDYVRQGCGATDKIVSRIFGPQHS